MIISPCTTLSLLPVYLLAPAHVFIFTMLAMYSMFKTINCYYSHLPGEGARAGRERDNR